MMIRRYCSHDCEATIKLFYDTVHRINAAHYDHRQLDAWAPKKRNVQEWNRSFIEHDSIVAEEQGKIVGFADLAENGYLDRLYVHADTQRQGIGSAMLTFLENKAKQSGISQMETHASITARPFFERYGYQVVCSQKVERNGQMLTNYVMRKKLK